jgi:hypothetical protein
MMSSTTQMAKLGALASLRACAFYPLHEFLVFGFCDFPLRGADRFLIVVAGLEAEQDATRERAWSGPWRCMRMPSPLGV